jgi:two-component sensor histidine kinase
MTKVKEGSNKFRKVYFTLGFILLLGVLPHAVRAQTLDFLPDSTKKTLATLPESMHDSIYGDAGATFYSTFTDEGYVQALVCFNRMLDLTEKYQHKQMRIIAYQFIASIYDAQGDNPPKILEYYKKAYDLTMLEKLPEFPTGVAYSLAHAYNLMHDSANAMKYLHLLDTDNNGYRESNPVRFDRISLLVAYQYMQNNNIKAFIQRFESLNKNFVYENGRFPYARYFALCSWRYSFEKGDFQTAIQNLHKDLKNNPSDSSLLMGFLQSAYAKVGDYHNAYLWLNTLSQFDDARQKINVQKDLTVKLLNTDNMFKEKEKQLLNREKIFLWIGFLLTLLASAIIGYFWYVNHKQNNTLTLRNKEKEVLVNEVQHRVKNNLQLLYSLSNLQLDNIKDESAREIWKKNISQLQAMIDVNEKMYLTEGGGVIDLEPFITDILAELNHIYLNDTTINITQNIDNSIHVSPQFAISFGLILTELTTNSFKYALKDTPNPFVNIVIKKQDDNNLVFEYSDSGKLSDPSVLETKKIGGMSLMKDLTRQLNGEVVLKQEPQLTFTFHLPI